MRDSVTLQAYLPWGNKYRRGIVVQKRHHSIHPTRSAFVCKHRKSSKNGRIFYLNPWGIELFWRLHTNIFAFSIISRCHCPWGRNKYSALIFDWAVSTCIVENLCLFLEGISASVMYHNLWWPNVLISHCGLVVPYGDINLGHHWLRQWLVAWGLQAITWTNVDFSSMGSVTFIWGHFPRKYPSYQSVRWVWKLLFFKYCPISQGPMS